MAPDSKVSKKYQIELLKAGLTVMDRKGKAWRMPLTPPLLYRLILDKPYRVAKCDEGCEVMDVIAQVGGLYP